MCCSVLQCVAVCCSVLQCAAYALHTNVLQRVTCHAYFRMCCTVLQCVALCCSVLQCVAVCCSVTCHAYFRMTYKELQRINDHVKGRLRQADTLHSCSVVPWREAHQVQQLLGSTQFPGAQNTCTWRWAYICCVGMFMYIDICIHMYTYIHIHMYVYIYLYTNIYTNKHVYIC